MSSRDDSGSESNQLDTFDLSCVNCDYGATINGELEDVLSAIEEHREEHAGGIGRHYVEFSVRR